MKVCESIRVFLSIADGISKPTIIDVLVDFGL